MVTPCLINTVQMVRILASRVFARGLHIPNVVRSFRLADERVQARSIFSITLRLMSTLPSSGATTKAYIALGSNVGDRIRNIESACRHLDDAGLRVLRTSLLYDTKPMYVEKQQNFINGVCEVRYS